MISFDQSNSTHRALVALVAAGLVTFAVWGVWMTLGAVFGVLGWGFSKLGEIFLWAMNGIKDVHGIVAWIGVGCGTVVGAIIGFNLRADRLWSRLSGRHRPAGENRDSNSFSSAG